jgi:hypothetical protein
VDGDASQGDSDFARKQQQLTVCAGRSREGENNSNHKIAEAQALEIWKRLQSGEKAPKCAEEFGISVHIVRSIKYGKRWTHITGLENRRKQSSGSLTRTRDSPTSVTAGAFDAADSSDSAPTSPADRVVELEPKKPKLVRCLLSDSESPRSSQQFLSSADEVELSVVSLLSSRFAVRSERGSALGSAAAVC